jgi:hypothetical protein
VGWREGARRCVSVCMGGRAHSLRFCLTFNAPAAALAARDDREGTGGGTGGSITGGGPGGGPSMAWSALCEKSNGR